jgi:aquaporin Z
MERHDISPPQRRHAVPFGRALEFTRADFDNPALEWRRLFSEVLGTFLLVLVAAGGGVVNAESQNAIGRAAAVTAPGLMVLVVILFMGAISGAHLNPAVSIALLHVATFPGAACPATW